MLKLLLAACLVVSSAQAVPETTKPVAQIVIPVDDIARAKFPKDPPQGVDGLAWLNKAVNGSIQYETDQAHYGQPERFIAFPPDHKGDCEDIAMSKMEFLGNAGFDIVERARLVSVVVHWKDRLGKDNYDGHMILAVLLPSGAVAYLDSNNAELMTRPELEARGYIFNDWKA